MNIAAVWEMIFAGEWGRIWWGITHAHWANVWASISAIFTAAAVGVAGCALVRWNKQDKLKAKMDFKIAIADYLTSVLSLHDVNRKNPNSEKDAKLLLKVIDDFTKCRHAWWKLEGILESEKDIKAAWEALSEKNNHFINGVIEEKEITKHCSVILSKKFVFK